ncbi:flowering time control protein FPA [Diospyros lotus]|uniref:flowering time control protein FPA n=1 Tax=Diospyros lotus TaxID=55363 RepID=UPI002250E347|nr:flowering time control protein FPA [Diospyros lotus]
MAHIGKSTRQDSEPPSSNLWVGNLATDVTDADLMNLFSKYGPIDSVTSYASRSYAFVHFKRVEDAKAACEALRGTPFRGNSLKIEFAKPAKPCKSLWVSGISPSITKEILEAELLKFGKIEEFKFLRDRNTAYVDYFRLEDASQALKSMNGKRMGGSQIRVDFLRSHTSRKEHMPDHGDARGQFLRASMGPDSPWMPQETVRNLFDPMHSGSKRLLHSQSSGPRKLDEQLSNVLRVGYPPTVHIDEQLLHNAMILFGEIEGIKSFTSKHFSLVEFRSVDEARRAKEGLQGRLFNDPRISIMYYSDLATGKDHPGIYPGVKGPRPDVFFNEPAFPPRQVEFFNHSGPMMPNNLSGALPSGGSLEPNMLTRPFGLQDGYEPLLLGSEFNDLNALHKFPDASANNLVAGPNWRRSSPAPLILPSPSQGAKRPIRPMSGAWDIFDASQLERESKRSKIETVLPAYGSPFSSKQMEDRGLSNLDRLYGLGAEVDGGISGTLANAQEKSRFSPADFRMTTGGAGQGHLDRGHIWRGVIAKGGTPVCRARCVSIGEGIESEIPEVVNCSARTGLDMLTKHYADAIDYRAVYFLPDSEDDFASYTEFLQYLGVKERAGVAKFDDGTMLFLVPPSDFLSKVLKIVGPQRLYGVVLKFPQHEPSSTPVQPQSLKSYYIDRQQMSSQNEYTGIPQREEKVLQMDYGRVLREDALPHTMQLAPSTTDSIIMQPPPLVKAPAVPQAGVALTPELIATLASLANAKSSGSDSAQPPMGSSSMQTTLPSIEPNRVSLPQVWVHDRQGAEQIGHSMHQVENQYDPQRQQLAPLPAYTTGLNPSSNSALVLTADSQIQNPVSHLPQHNAASSWPLSNYGIPSDGGQLEVPPQVNQLQNGSRMAHSADSLGSYNPSAYQLASNSVTLSNQVPRSDVTQPYPVTPLGADKGNSELVNQVQQLKSTNYVANQGTSEVEDKNQRYQSTLQFAANLLFQLQQQQQQQQASTEGGQGSANQQ